MLILGILTNKPSNYDDQSDTDLIADESSNNVIDLINQIKSVESSDISPNNVIGNVTQVKIKVVTNTAPLRTQE